MKKSILLGLAGMMFVSTAAHAISVTGQAGEHYTNLGVGFGTESSGLAVTGNWMHSDNDGDAAGLGLGLNIPLGPFLATVGGKGVYTNPKQGDEGYAAAVGGGVCGEVGIGPVDEVGVEDHPGEVSGEPRARCPGGQQTAAVERFGRRNVDRLRLHPAKLKVLSCSLPFYIPATVCFPTLNIPVKPAPSAAK